MKKKYSYQDRLNYYQKKRDFLKSKGKLTKREFGQLMFAKGYIDLARNKEDFSFVSPAYVEGCRRSLECQIKAYNFKF